MNANSAQFVASNDLDLVHASKKGDAAAFEQLVKRYDRRLLRISHTVTRNREDSEDAVQEALLKAFQNLAEFREDSQFSTWLIRITVNQSLMKLRKRAHKEVSLAGGRGASIGRPRSSPESGATMLGFRIARHPCQNRARIAPDLADGLCTP
jgi:DNA-directed RNA polymerase specialized sigma24 family protein